MRANCPGQLLCEAEFRQEIPGGNFSRSFQPCNILSSKDSCLLLGRWFLLENYMRGKTRENLKGEFLGEITEINEELKRSLSTNRLLEEVLRIGRVEESDRGK